MGCDLAVLKLFPHGEGIPLYGRYPGIGFSTLKPSEGGL
jgi:hypothetical protein